MKSKIQSRESEPAEQQTFVLGVSVADFAPTVHSHKVQVTQLLNDTFLKPSAVPTVVPEGTSVMRIRQENALRKIEKMNYFEKLQHCPSILALQKKERDIKNIKKDELKPRMVFLSGVGWVFKSFK